MAEHQAREIERLTAERDSVSIECDMLNACNDSLASDLRRLQAERDRLRAALTEIHEMSQEHLVPAWQVIQNITATANRALAEHVDWE